VGTDPDKTGNLIERTRNGDEAAFETLFNRHRVQLRRFIAMRMDRRMATRVDASDILQETYMDAFRRFSSYLRQDAMPFHLWLHWIAREKVIGMHRRHLGAGKRAVQHEVPLMPVDSSADLVSGLMGRMASPSQELARAELAEQLRVALGRLDADERDLILWRHFEQLSARDMALLLDITEAAANKRYIRAVEKLRKILNDMGVSGPAR
jgi:RNA polymerase sigma-70 factor (ECF subfamily)